MVTSNGMDLAASPGSGHGMTPAGHRVVPTSVQRMTPQDPTYGEPPTARRTMAGYRLARVGTAGRQEATPRAEERAAGGPVTGEQDEQEPSHRTGAGPASDTLVGVRGEWPHPGLPRARANARSRSARSRLLGRVAAAGRARTTTRTPGERPPLWGQGEESSSALRWRGLSIGRSTTT